MKTIITCLLMALTISINAQQLVDDFSTGSLNQTNVKALGETKYNQTGNKILHKKRWVTIKIGQNDEKQLLQTKISNGKLIASMGYGITGNIELRYGGNREDALNIDLSKYKTLNIAYEAKSNFGRVYVSMFSNGPNRFFWRGGGNRNTIFKGSIAPNGSNRPFVLKIPLSEFTKAEHKNGTKNAFTIKDVDFFKIQLISQGAQGLNFGVKKIWFE